MYKNRMLPNDLYKNFRFQDLNECFRTFTLNYDELFATCAGFIISIGRLSARFGVAYKPSVKKGIKYSCLTTAKSAMNYI